MKFMGTVRPTVFKLVEGLLREQNETEHMLSRIEAGQDPAPQRPKYVERDRMMIAIVKKFSEKVVEDETFIPYLKMIAHV